MTRVPRIALGTIQPEADLRAISIALLQTLHRAGLQVQSFASDASRAGDFHSRAATGLPGRCLDSWLMSRETCRNLMFRSACGADLAVVTGALGRRAGGQPCGAELDRLCQWLDLPRVAVLDLRGVDRHGLPARPAADAVLLDHASGCESLEGMITDIAALWGLPVIGALGEVSPLRRQLDCLEPGEEPPAELCQQLSEAFLPHWQPDRFAGIAQSAPPIEIWSATAIQDISSMRPTVAVAYDKAFFGYFPCTLDQLELLGAQVVDFSPLHDENLPAGTDIVYIGGGRPEAFAAALSENHCMKSALRSHVSAGGRVYGEAGGAAYLGEALETPSGAFFGMCGILPTIARLRPDCGPPEPVEVSLSQDNWLAPRGTRLRGYRNTRWRFQKLRCQLGIAGRSCCHADMAGCSCVVGSLVHFHFAAFPEIFASFFRPSLRTAAVLDPWRAVS